GCVREEAGGGEQGGAAGEDGGADEEAGGAGAQAFRRKGPPMTEMNPNGGEYTWAYLQEGFGREDEELAGLMARAVAAGMPDIAVSAEVGRLLKLLAMMCGEGRGAGLIVEIGTLAGYSGIWLARGLRAGGRLITIEIEAKHAA